MLPENKIIRTEAREILKGRWGQAILVMFIYMAVVSVWSIPGSGKQPGDPFNPVIDLMFPAVSFVISGPLAFGIACFFLSFVRREQYEISSMFEGFKQFSRTFTAYFLMTLFTVLWALLLIVPGIIAALKYSQTFFVLRDNPQMSPQEAIRESIRLMDGYKMKYFLLGLSFIGWVLLGCLTLGIGLLWVMPYIETSLTVFYLRRTEAQ
ncbi:MAG: DUF975 family protein [Spirochaetales bacterium]|nr:DUF975 family protein [Spirochaetales bacterium]